MRVKVKNLMRSTSNHILKFCCNRFKITNFVRMLLSSGSLQLFNCALELVATPRQPYGSERQIWADFPLPRSESMSVDVFGELMGHNNSVAYQRW